MTGCSAHGALTFPTQLCGCARQGGRHFRFRRGYKVRAPAPPRAWRARPGAAAASACVCRRLAGGFCMLGLTGALCACACQGSCLVVWTTGLRQCAPHASELI